MYAKGLRPYTVHVGGGSVCVAILHRRVVLPVDVLHRMLSFLGENHGYRTRPVGRSN